LYKGGSRGKDETVLGPVFGAELGWELPNSGRARDLRNCGRPLVSPIHVQKPR